MLLLLNSLVDSIKIDTDNISDYKIHTKFIFIFKHCIQSLFTIQLRILIQNNQIIYNENYLRNSEKPQLHKTLQFSNCEFNP